MTISVHSEITPLRHVLLHRPGAELEHLYPDSLPHLLFDDIPFLKQARIEHDHFADILRGEGVEVSYLEDLVADVLRQSEDIRHQFVKDFVEMSDIRNPHAEARVIHTLLSYENTHDLVLKTMAGLEYDQVVGLQPRRLATYVGREPQSFILDPIPNLYFVRDPFASIGRGVSLHHMYSPTRRRETIYGRYLLDYHPDFIGTPRYYTPEMPPSIEGGDILNLTPSVLAVGLSQRTGPGAVETLATNLFQSEESKIKTVLAISIPARRAFMHLDTVFTQLNENSFVVHPGILSNLRIFELTPGKGGEPLIRELSESLEEVLARCLEQDTIQLIPCGGDNQIASEREQWNDGSNTLCIRPGVVVVYDRNTVTNALIEAKDIEVRAMPSSELSRGRGGPRCMSMPLVRDLPSALHKPIS